MSRLLLSQRPDLVHVWPRAVLRTAATARRLGIVSVREAPSPYTRVAATQAQAAWAQLGMEVPPNHFHRIPERDLAVEDDEFEAVDTVLVGSEQAAASFQQAAFPVTVRVNPYGFDESMFPEQRPEPGDTTTVVFVGRCEPTKGIHHLLRAWIRASRPPNARLLLCGDLTEPVRVRLASALGDRTVTHLGPISPVSDVLLRSAVLALPSLSEGSALVGYEALGAGAVPLVSRASGCPVVHGVTGLVHETGDEDQLTAHLETVLNDVGTLERLRQGAMEDRQAWTWESAGRRLKQTYASLIAQAPEG